MTYVRTSNALSLEHMGGPLRLQGINHTIVCISSTIVLMLELCSTTIDMDVVDQPTLALPHIEVIFWQKG